MKHALLHCALGKRSQGNPQAIPEQNQGYNRPKNEVPIFTILRVLGLNRLSTVSMPTCLSFFNTQAAPRKTTHNRENSDSSVTPVIGARRKYLAATSTLMKSIMKIVSDPRQECQKPNNTVKDSHYQRHQLHN